MNIRLMYLTTTAQNIWGGAGIDGEDLTVDLLIHNTHTTNVDVNIVLLYQGQDTGARAGVSIFKKTMSAGELVTIEEVDINKDQTLRGVASVTSVVSVKIDEN